MIDSTLRDLRYAIRQIAHIPIITGVSVVLIAFGIATNAALLSFLDVVLLQPKPGISDAQGLMRLYPYVGPPQQSASWRFDEFLELRDQQKSFTDVAGVISGAQVAVEAAGITKLTPVRYVTGAYFPVMRLPLEAGRGFPVVNDRNPGPPEAIAVVSYTYWQTTLGGDSVIGRTIRLNRVPFEIIGVLPKGFRDGEDDVSVWLPLASRPLLLSATQQNTSPRPGASTGSPPLPSTAGLFVRRVLGRLRPDVDRDRATAALSAMAAGWGTSFRTGERDRPITRVIAYPEGWLGPDEKGEFAQIAGMLGALAIMVLLIACANVSVLLLGRAVVRRRELALRLAIGAARGRVVRQLLTENILMAVIASIASMMFLQWANGFVLSKFPEMPFDLGPSWRTVLATLVFACGTGVVFGLLPALSATDTSIHEAMKSGGIGGDPKKARLQRRFVVAEVAMSTALICATGLLINELRKEFSSTTPDPFASENVLAADLPMGTLRYPMSRVDRIIEELNRLLSAQPGVVAVAASGRTRFDYFFPRDTAAKQGGGEAPGETASDNTVYTMPVTPRFFNARNRTLLSGREFTAEDRAGAQPVAIVDSAIAVKYWPGQNPLGQLLHISRRAGRDTLRHELLVVGVTHTRRRSNNPEFDQTREIFVPMAQMPDSLGLSIFMRTTGPARERSQAVQVIIRSVDPDLPIAEVSTTWERATRSRKEMMQVAAAVSSFGAITLFMACVGVYAVIAFGVAQRTREIGIRIAIGANPNQVVGHFWRSGVRLAVIGTAIGVPACILIMRFGFGNEFPAEMFQPLAIATITVVVLAVVGLACWVPARGAARVQPMDALRAD